jgi:hypothetical protein
MNRAHRSNIAVGATGAALEEEGQTSTTLRLKKKVAELELAVMREVAGLKELIHYRDKTSEADREYKERLQASFASILNPDSPY